MNTSQGEFSFCPRNPMFVIGPSGKVHRVLNIRWTTVNNDVIHERA